MSTRKININRSEPSRQETDAYKNFGQIIQKHQQFTKRPKYNQIKTLIGIMLVLVILLLLFLDYQERQKQDKPSSEAHTESTK